MELWSCPTATGNQLEPGPNSAATSARNGRVGQAEKIGEHRLRDASPRQFGVDVVCNVRARHKFPLVSSFIAANGYRAYRVESLVEGIGRHHTLDPVAWP